MYDDVASVLSTSYGTCEQYLGSAGNQFWNALWQQAAAQGQTSFVSAGDGGPAGCDNFDNFQPAQLGIAMNDTSSRGPAPATFNLTNTAGSATQVLATSGSGQSAAVSTAFAAPLVATVEDTYGNVVSGATVTFTAPASGASRTFKTSGTNSEQDTTNSSGVATSSTFTANSTVGGPYSVTGAVSGVTSTASYSLTNTAESCTNNANFKGNYALLMQGWTSAGGGNYVFMSVAGELTADGAGNITGGQYDQNDPYDGYQSGTLSASTYCLASNNMGTLTINGGEHPSTMAFVVQSDGNGSMILYEADAPMLTGTLMKQTTSAFTTSAFSGQYSMGWVGIDENSNRESLDGAFTLNGTANLTNGQSDANDNGTYAPMTFSATDFTVASTGRGTVSILPSGATTTLDLAFYVVNASQLFIISTDNVSSGYPLFSGQIIKQSGLTYSSSDLDGVSVMGQQRTSTNGSGQCPEAEAGLITWTTSGSGGSGSYNGEDDSCSTMSTSSGTGTYTSVGSNGRVVITGPNHPLVLYLTGKNAAFEIQEDDSGVTAGMLYAQSGSNFNGESLSGNFYGGSWQPVLSTGCTDIDVASLTPGTGDNGSGSIVDDSDCGSGPGTNTINGTYTVQSNGEVTFTPTGSGNGNGAYVYIISPTADGKGGSFMTVPNGDNNPKIETWQQ